MTTKQTKLRKFPRWVVSEKKPGEEVLYYMGDATEGKNMRTVWCSDQGLAMHFRSAVKAAEIIDEMDEPEMRFIMLSAVKAPL